MKKMCKVLYLLVDGKTVKKQKKEKMHIFSIVKIIVSIT